MNFAAMKTLLEYYVDDTVDTPIALTLVNEGKNKMAAAVHAKFPDIVESGTGDTFVFDERFHELPVLYAAAMVKAYDSSIREKESFMFDFQSGLKDFVKEYSPPIQYVKGDFLQSFTAVAGDTTFTVTDSSFSTYGNVDVYLNSSPVPHTRNGNVITLVNPLVGGETVTVTWDPLGYDNVQPWMRMW